MKERDNKTVVEKKLSILENMAPKSFDTILEEDT